MNHSPITMLRLNPIQIDMLRFMASPWINGYAASIEFWRFEDWHGDLNKTFSIESFLLSLEAKGMIKNVHEFVPGLPNSGDDALWLLTPTGRQIAEMAELAGFPMPAESPAIAFAGGAA